MIPERITHNDTKLDNVLFDAATGEGLCVLDLDTVMPGLGLYDFGDLVRSVVNPVAEDEPDVSQVTVQVPVFEAIARGYVDAMGRTLRPSERDHLVLAGQVITFECGLRFLTDFLDGDRYFRTHRADQNLQRCRVQFALLRSLEEHEAELNRIVASLGGGTAGS